AAETRETRERTSSDADLRRLRHRVAVVAGPLEFQRAALGGHGGEGDERIGGHGRIQIGAEDFDAVVAAGEARDDVARHELAALGAAEAALHHVPGERADFDDLAALRACRHVDDDARDQINPSSRHAESVTTTEVVSDQKEPSDICAMAMTLPVSAMRARVEKRAFPERGPRCAPITNGCGFFSVRIWIALTWSASVIGLSTVTVIGTVLPLSMSGGISIFTLPARTGASPAIFRWAPSRAARRSSAMLAGSCATALPAATTPTPRPTNCLLVIISALPGRRQRHRSALRCAGSCRAATAPRGSGPRSCCT